MIGSGKIAKTLLSLFLAASLSEAACAAPAGAGNRRVEPQRRAKALE